MTIRPVRNPAGCPSFRAGGEEDPCTIFSNRFTEGNPLSLPRFSHPDERDAPVRRHRRVERATAVHGTLDA